MTLFDELLKELFEYTLIYGELSEKVIEQLSVEQLEKVKNGTGKVIALERKDGVLTPIKLTEKKKNDSVKKMSLISMLEETRVKDRPQGNLLIESMSLHRHFIESSMSLLICDSSTPDPILSKKKKKKFTKKKQQGARIVPRKQKNVSYKQNNKGYR